MPPTPSLARPVAGATSRTTSIAIVYTDSSPLEQAAEIEVGLGSQARRRVSGELHSPHRLCSWMLAAFTLAALTVGALGWSMVLAGRWTILSATAVVSTFMALLTSGYFRVNMSEEGAFKVRLAGAASAIGVTAALMVVSIPGLGQPSVPSFVALMAVLVTAGTAARTVGRWLLVHMWSHGHLRARALVFGYDELAREMAVEIALRPTYGVDIVGYLVPCPYPSTPIPTGQVIAEQLVDPSRPLPSRHRRCAKSHRRRPTDCGTGGRLRRQLGPEGGPLGWPAGHRGACGAPLPCHGHRPGLDVT